MNSEGCPTCSHTLAVVLIDEATDYRCSICDRCGTCAVSRMVLDTWVRESVYVPRLVERCREFTAGWHRYNPASHLSIELLEKAWISAGIRDSINRPEDRK